MIGHEALRRWTGVPLLTLLSFPRLWGLEPAQPPAALTPAERVCRQVSPELSECALLDGPQDRAAGPRGLRGVEWVLSDQGYRRLSEEERRCWTRGTDGRWVSRGSPAGSWRGPDACR